MPVDCIADLQQIDALKSDWNRIYRADAHAQIFLSWAWLRAHLPTMRRRWFILAYRAGVDAPYSALLPLASESFPAGSALLNRDLYLMGSPYADYTGLLADPAGEEVALREFGRHLRGEAWDNFYAADVMDPRLGRLMKALADKDAQLVDRGRTTCPFIPLPSTWDEYLRGYLTKHFRAVLKSRIRRIESLPGFRAVAFDADNVRFHIDKTLEFAQHRRPNSPGYRKDQRTLLLNCFASGSLWGLALWCERGLLSTVIAFPDRCKGEFAVYKVAFNPAFASLSPGTAILGLSIKYAIENGFRVYDFTRGAERYKFLFAKQIRHTYHLSVTRPSVRCAIGNAVRPLIRMPVRLTEKLLSHRPA